MTIRVLIIDENRPAREMLARRLGSIPGILMVGSTGDSKEGLQQIKDCAPDIVLLDIKMKRADGLEVCRQACSISGKARVVVLTSYTEPGERKMAFESGASDYLLKEVDTPKLVQRIRQLTEANQVSSGCCSGEPSGH